MNRRIALKKIGISLGTITLTPTIISMFQGCQTQIDWSPSFFSKDQIQFISDMLDIVLPKTTDLPGAKELNVSRFIDTYANLSMDEKTKFRVNNTLNSLIKNTLNQFSKSKVSKLTSENYKSQLNKFLFAEENKTNEWNNLANNYWLKSSKNEIISEPEEALSYISTLSIREWGVMGFRYSEFIGEKVLPYRPIPGEQKGCVDLQSTTEGLIWSI
tara:strand:- start:998 stop:1642 length:645 start_codon:yes stop_codon:yes gene_type:complete